MEKKKKIATVAISTTIAALLGGSLTSVPANAEPTTSNVSFSQDQIQAPSSTDDALIPALNELVAAINLPYLTYDERKVTPEIVASPEGIGFRNEFLNEGGTVIDSVGMVVPPTHPPISMSQGSAWVDGWGFHMTLPGDIVDRIVDFAGRGSEGAGMIAAMLGISIQGFPISTMGALAAGAVALALIGICLALQACNIRGNGAQVNYNWILWTCWPL